MKLIKSEEFESHNLGNVELQHRNVCKDGFGELSDVEASELAFWHRRAFLTPSLPRLAGPLGGHSPRG